MQCLRLRLGEIQIQTQARARPEPLISIARQENQNSTARRRSIRADRAGADICHPGDPQRDNYDEDEDTPSRALRSPLSLSALRVASSE
jgi:hypothetical protein